MKIHEKVDKKRIDQSSYKIKDKEKDIIEMKHHTKDKIVNLNEELNIEYLESINKQDGILITNNMFNQIKAIINNNF